MTVILLVASEAEQCRFLGSKGPLMTVTANNLHLVLQLPLLQHWEQGTKLAHCVPVKKS